MPSRSPRVSKTSMLLQNCASESLSGVYFPACVLQILHKASRSTSYNLFIYKGRLPWQEGEGRAKPRCRGPGGPVLLHRAAHQRAPAPTPSRPSYTRGQVLKVPVLQNAFLSAPNSFQGSVHSPTFSPAHPQLPGACRSPFPASRERGRRSRAPLTHTLPPGTLFRNLGQVFLGGRYPGHSRGQVGQGFSSPARPPHRPPPPHAAGLEKNTAPGGPGAHFLRSLE